MVRSKNGEPVPQWSSAEGEGDNTFLEVPEIPAKSHFLDVTEGVTALGYRATIDHRFTQVNYQRLKQLSHKLAVTLIEGSIVQAHISFRAWGDDSTLPRLPEGAFIKIHINISSSEKMQKISAFSISSALGKARG
ncbi:MAG: hypothetical protein Q9225_007452 [Loekoesia sp. 1 TL-2023]